MDKKNVEIKKLIDKFKKIKRKNGTSCLAMGSGIFKHKMRLKVLGIKKRPKQGQPAKDFWQKRRDSVERALIDLRLFVEVAGRKNIDQIITRDSLRPVVETLLWRPLVMDKYIHDEAVYSSVPDLNLAEIAQLLIETGFVYLCSIFKDSEHGISPSIQTNIYNAIEDSKHLVFQVEDLRKAAIERNKEIAALAAEELEKREISHE